MRRAVLREGRARGASSGLGAVEAQLLIRMRRRARSARPSRVIAIQLTRRRVSAAAAVARGMLGGLE